MTASSIPARCARSCAPDTMIITAPRRSSTSRCAGRPALEHDPEGLRSGTRRLPHLRHRWQRCFAELTSVLSVPAKALAAAPALSIPSTTYDLRQTYGDSRLTVTVHLIDTVTYGDSA